MLLRRADARCAVNFSENTVAGILVNRLVRGFYCGRKAAERQFSREILLRMLLAAAEYSEWYPASEHSAMLI